MVNRLAKEKEKKAKNTGTISLFSNEMFPESFFEFPDFGSMRHGLMRSMFGQDSMKIDLARNGDKYVLKANLPGVDKDGISIKATEDSITISAKSSAEREHQGKNFYYKERRSSGYFRSVPMPSSIVPKSVKASFKDGVLEVTAKIQKLGKESEIRIE